MNWQSYYLPPDPTAWQVQMENLPVNACFFQSVCPLNLTNGGSQITSSSSMFALFRLKNEGALEEIKSMDASSTVIQYLAKLPLHKNSIHFYDAGTFIYSASDNVEVIQEALAGAITLLLEQHIRPIIISDKHYLTWMQCALKKLHSKDKNIGVLDFDAHFDKGLLTPEGIPNNHIDYNCIGIQNANNLEQEFEIAKRHHVRFLLADELHQGHFEKCADFIDRIVDENDILYTKLSLDVFSADYAPGISANQILGLTPWQIIPLIRQVAGSGKVAVYDFIECLSCHDRDHRAAQLLAILISEIIHHHPERK